MIYFILKESQMIPFSEWWSEYREEQTEIHLGKQFAKIIHFHFKLNFPNNSFKQATDPSTIY